MGSIVILTLIYPVKKKRKKERSNRMYILHRTLHCAGSIYPLNAPLSRNADTYSTSTGFDTMEENIGSLKFYGSVIQFLYVNYHNPSISRLCLALICWRYWLISSRYAHGIIYR